MREHLIAFIKAAAAKQDGTNREDNGGPALRGRDMKLKKVECPDGSVRYYFYCPACKELHNFQTGSKSGPNWSFDGDVEYPTVSPSLLMSTTHPETKVRRTLCHLFVKGGKIEYCGDCPHEFAGRTVALPDVPEGLL